MRAAAARAASRRGSSTTILPVAAKGSSSSASGTRVVLPAPGGATSTARVPASSAATSRGRASSIGSGSAKARMRLNTADGERGKRPKPFSRSRRRRREAPDGGLAAGRAAARRSAQTRCGSARRSFPVGDDGEPTADEGHPGGENAIGGKSGPDAPVLRDRRHEEGERERADPAAGRRKADRLALRQRETLCRPASSPPGSRSSSPGRPGTTIPCRCRR